MKILRNLIIISSMFFCLQTFAQKNDTITLKHSAKKAALMSTVLPGLGQTYNQKYWKVPVLYIGLGTLTYFLINNNTQYNNYRQAYKYRTDNDKSTIDLYPFLSPDQLKINRDIYRGNLELTVILTAGLYIINIVDASVDAHLFKFNVSEDLSFNISPILLKQNMLNCNNTAGLSLKLNF